MLRTVRRIPKGLRYLRSHGVHATWHRLFPRTRTYQSWIDSYDTLSAADTRAIVEQVAKLPHRPFFSVLLPIDANAVRASSVGPTITSALAQLYPNFELCVAICPEASRAAASHLSDAIGDLGLVKLAPTPDGDDLAAILRATMSIAAGEFVVILEPGDELPPHSLYYLALEVIQFPDADIVYSDEDTIRSKTRIRTTPAFKGDWNYDLFLGHDSIGRLAALRRSLVEHVGGFTSELLCTEYDMILRLVEHTRPNRIRHIPAILYHRGAAESPALQTSAPAREKALIAHFARRGLLATPERAASDAIRIRYSLPSPAPGVSLIIPTRDKVELLRRCVDGLLSRTSYENFEIIIVDNDSITSEMHSYFSYISMNEKIRILKVEGKFNYSKINNLAVSFSRQKILGFLNNDVEIIDEKWLSEMAMLVTRPEIGVVGAKLYYPNNTIQHAGTIVGLGGLAGHAFRHFPRHAAGYLHRLRYVQSMSAVTGACMLVRKEVFEAVGGLDPENLPVAYNDVDFCLRVQELGYRNVWTPFAELYHHESGSRPSDHSRERIDDYKAEVTYLKARWEHVIRQDPYYNPNLTIESEDFSLAFPPRVKKPWITVD